MNRPPFVSNIFIGMLLILFSGCGQASPDVSAISSLSEPSRPAIKLDTNPVARSQLVPENVAILAFIMSGKVENTFVEIGDEVHRGDVLVQLDTTTLSADVLRAENVLKIAQIQYDLQIEQQNDSDAQTIAAANVAIAEADVRRARYMLTQAALIAPFDGTIVDVQAAPGEIVTSGKEIVTLADLKTMQVETLDLDEMDISSVYIGQTVQIYVNALDTTINGNVVAIAPQIAQMDKGKICKVIIHLDSQPQGLLWGMSADAKFIIDE